MSTQTYSASDFRNILGEIATVLNADGKPAFTHVVYSISREFDKLSKPIPAGQEFDSWVIATYNKKAGK